MDIGIVAVRVFKRQLHVVPDRSVSFKDCLLLLDLIVVVIIVKAVHIVQLALAHGNDAAKLFCITVFDIINTLIHKPQDQKIIVLG